MKFLYGVGGGGGGLLMQWCQLVPLLRLKKLYVKQYTMKVPTLRLSFLDGFDELPDICLASQSVL